MCLFVRIDTYHSDMYHLRNEGVKKYGVVVTPKESEIVGSMPGVLPLFSANHFFHLIFCCRRHRRVWFHDQVRLGPNVL